MTSPIIHHPERPASEAEIAAFEKRIGSRLPDDYRRFLSTYNGGIPEPAWHRKSDVKEFLTLDSLSEAPRLDRFFVIMRDRIPDDMISVAVDSVGDVMCLRVGREGYGEVHFWDMGAESDEARSGNQYYNTTKLASSFAEFVASLSDRRSARRS